MAETTRPPNLAGIKNFLLSAQHYGSRVAIAVGVKDQRSLELNELVASVRKEVSKACVSIPVDVIPVTPWGRFVPALNALLAHAVCTSCPLILYQSLEMEVESTAIHSLRQQLEDGSVCVAGAALPGHAYDAGRKVMLAGNTTPWNTLALWRVSTLALTGFLSVADGPNGLDGGVEEVSAIATLQKLVASEAGAVLIQLPGLEWKTDFDDPQRAKWHEKKMASKVARPAAHLGAIGLSGFGAVFHV
eukprot:CAMPEP_0175122564 /NCGR_PEP_ID=MMETSP0087-20121206/1782_1 /TAXON_ID=136419 /ORGANISM="Unknown Unknown, Strain D1" /LENGTH=245 /DNA_ID=CAMNT_0016404207 /DNA_START=89 /DNA_END=826 /DNA_ORIENTATION=-